MEAGKPVIDGRALKVSLTKEDVQVFGAVRLWDKTQRSTLMVARDMADINEKDGDVLIFRLVERH